MPNLVSVEEEKLSDEEMLPAEEIRDSVNPIALELNYSSGRHSIFNYNNISCSFNAPVSQNRWSSFGGQGSSNGLVCSSADDQPSSDAKPEGQTEQLSSYTLGSGNSFQDMLAKMSMLGSGPAN